MGSLKLDFRTGECPGTHPVRLPQIAVFTRVAPYHGGIHLFSDGTGYFHADYFSGWEAAQLQKVLDECENDSMESAPDAWCEDHVTFRDAPKSEDVEDEELRAKLEPFQPAPFDATRILSEAVDGVPDLPGGLQPVIDPAASTATNVEMKLGEIERTRCHAHGATFIVEATVQGVVLVALLQHAYTRNRAAQPPTALPARALGSPAPLVKSWIAGYSWI